MAALEAEDGGREMDAPRGASEIASEGFLRPEIPRWKQFSFWLFVVFFVLVVGGRSSRPHPAIGEGSGGWKRNRSWASPGGCAMFEGRKVEVEGAFFSFFLSCNKTSSGGCIL